MAGEINIDPTDDGGAEICVEAKDGEHDGQEIVIPLDADELAEFIHALQRAKGTARTMGMSKDGQA